MWPKYSYYFNSTPNPSYFKQVFIGDLGQGRAAIDLIPTGKDVKYEKILQTWKSLQSLAAKSFTTWIPVVSYCTGPADKGRFRKAQLFSYSMILHFGWEIEPPVNIGCPLCGRGRIINPKATIDEKSLISWDYGFSNTGRFIVHIDRYGEILENKLTGFKPQPLDCLYPDHYVLMFWQEGMDMVEKIVGSYDYLFQSDLTYKENGRRLIYFMPRELDHDKRFLALHDKLMKLHDLEEIFYQLIPPARQVGELPKCRWVGLDIYGKAGSEIELNTYDERAQCPACGKGGWEPNGQLVLDHSQWDGSDICQTEVGRIIISKKAYNLFGKKWNGWTEPIADYRDAIKIQ